MSLSKQDRLAMARAFKEVQAYLKALPRTQFICNVLTILQESGVIDSHTLWLCKRLIEYRLSGSGTYEGWVIAHHQKLWYETVLKAEAAQKGRQAWLKSLVREFSS